MAMDTKDNGSNIPLKTRWVISSVCLLLLVVDIALRIPQQHGFGSFEAVLVLAGLAPWLVGAIEEIGFGGARLKLQIDRNESDINAIRVALRAILTKHEFGPLKALEGPGKAEIRKNRI